METLSLPLIIALILTCCLITGGLVCSGNAQFVECQESDREALLDLKKGLEDSENQLSSWQGSNCCKWWGIGCDNSTGAVIAVDLHNPYPSDYDSSGMYGFWNLSGEIKPSLTRIKSLTYLDLSFNTFNGTIPDFISSLEKLQHLNLSHAGFSGTIPQVLGNLSSLQVLDVSSSFPSLTVNNLEWVSGLVSLKYLAMTGTNLSKVGFGWLEALNKVPFLDELHLSGCGLSSIISSLAFVNFTSLAVLDLSGNNFNSNFPDWLVNISALVSVDISFSELYGRVPLGLGDLPKLQSLRLSNNYNLSASCSELFAGRWESIQLLDLFLNKLHGKIPASFGNLTSLVHIDFSNNGIEGSIPSSIGGLCNLEYLDLSANNLSGSLPELLEGVEKCLSKSPFPALQNFAASDNQLVGNLPVWLGQVRNLVMLNLQYNLLQGPIPPSYGALQNLSELRLEANKLNGRLPESLGQLFNLSVLDVSINQMTGIISESHFLGLNKLRILVLSANSFIFNVSANWIPPFQVWYLELGSCHLGPAFPTWIRTQKGLNFLDVSNASLSGSIPDWLWEMSSNLTLLNVSFNLLEGHLPNPLIMAPSALVNFGSNLFEGPIPLLSVGVDLLDLSNNKFSGPIPNEIGEISPRLVFLSLSGNQLDGSIPPSIGKMLSVEVIDLSSNNLSGDIPSSIGNCTCLTVLDLKNNNLSGVIPDSLGQLSLLQTLHLSSNRFWGEIQSTLLNLSSLETLDLGTNFLTGNIPPWIGDGFPHLRILRFRSNNFSGELPLTLSNLSSLQVLDLAENNLTGIIPASFGNLKAMSQQQIVNHYLFYGSYMTAYYKENLVVNINGQSRIYTKTLSLLTSIDLSGNNLYGEIPEELTKLVGLVVLNLSRNQISGELPRSISELHQLLSLDLSSNNLSGLLPPSMVSMTFLGYLNLSNNNLSGRIPYTDQMTTFNASSFTGNAGLCGPPLVVKCPGDDSSNGGGDRGGANEGGNGLIDKWFYLSIGVGFAGGLLLPYFFFAIKGSWSNAYFALVDKIVDRLLCGHNTSPTRGRN